MVRMSFVSAMAAWLAVLITLGVAAQAVLHGQSGPLPLGSVFEIPLLTVAALLAVAGAAGSLAGGHAVRWSKAGIRLASAAVLFFAVARLGGELWSPVPVAADPGSTTLTVLTWNLEMGGRAASLTIQGITAVDADLVSLQELTPDVAAAIEADPALRDRYPYRILVPDPGTGGMGLLAKRPLTGEGLRGGPLILWAGLHLDNGRIVQVLGVHPYPPGIRLIGALPLALNTVRRDDDLAAIAAEVAGLSDPALALVAGDLNTTPTEPGLDVLMGALTDAHAAVGIGPGPTWRFGPLEDLGLGLLRIDHVMTGAALTPVASTVDCTLPGDHCRLIVTLQVGP